MKKTLTFKCIALGVLIAMLLCSCSGVGDYLYTFDYAEPEILASVQASDSGAQEHKKYAENDKFELYVDEQNATFMVVYKDSHDVVWSSSPRTKGEDGTYSYKKDETKSLIQVNYSNQLGPVNSALNSYMDCITQGSTTVHQLENGVRFDFNFTNYGFVVPIQVLLHPQGVEISLLNKLIQENMEGFDITSVNVAPYFMATADGDDGYFLLPDGEGALADWNNVSSSDVTYRGFIYGRDNAITVYEQKTLQTDIRLPVFGAQWKPENASRQGYTAIVTTGASRAALNLNLSKGDNMAYSEFIYRDIARVKVESSTKLENFVERSNTQIPVQTVRYVLMVDENLNYVDMADTYRDYLEHEAGVTRKTQSGSAPMVVELFGGMMKQQFVLGFPVNKVMPLTTYEDAGEIVKALKNAGVDELVVNYTQWQKDGTGAAMQDSIQAEGELGGNKGLKNFIELCNEENISVYLDLNTNKMVKSAWGYDTKNDSTSTVRWDPAIQYYYNPNTGLPNMQAPTFLLAPTKLVSTASKLAESAGKYDITGVASTVLGSELYSDFAKQPYTRDHTEYFWNDALKALAETKGKLLLTGGNAYALDEATFITDAPKDYGKHQCMTCSVPFYQIVLHGLIPLSTPAINNAEDVQDAFLWAIETGSYLKWNWTARNQDELVESIFNQMTGSDYEKWIEVATKQYKDAQLLLKKIATYTVAEHEQMGEVVRVLWTNGTGTVEVYVNYGENACQVNGLTVEANSFEFRVK